MAEIFNFIPRFERDARKNLVDFIALAEGQLRTFGNGAKFTDDVWDVTDAVDLKGKRSKSRIHFTTLESVGDAQKSVMGDPFRSFAKAYLLYQQGMRPTKAISNRLTALRALESTLREMGHDSDPTATTIEVLNRTAQRLKGNFSKHAAYAFSNQLAIIAKFMSEHRLLALSVRWVNPLKRPSDITKVGASFDERRNKKLPSAAALNALPNIFQLATDAPDVIVASMTAILCAAPDRINEVLGLSEQCEVRSTVPSTGEPAYGLRYFPSKGAAPMIKWMVGTMSPVVQEAISRVRVLSSKARTIAKWYEDHPGQIYLRPECEYLRQRDRITSSELRMVLFESEVTISAVRTWCDTYGVRMEISSRRATVVFKEVEKAVLEMLPKGFPIADAQRGLKYSEALWLVQRNGMHGSKSNYNCAVEILDYGTIQDRLGRKTANRQNTIFDKYGFYEDDGSPIHLTTHQFRHYLNTLAQAGGLSQLDIAKWSGRTQVSQNVVYDHVSDRDIVEKVREMAGETRAVTVASAGRFGSQLVARHDFAQLELAAAHTTEFGYCIHDFSMSPCQIHRDCINCDEQVCRKGDAVRDANIRRHRSETAALIAAAESAAAGGDFGSDRWLEHQQLTYTRLDAICKLLDDVRVEPGAVIRLAKIVPASRIAQAYEVRAAIGEVEIGALEAANSSGSSIGKLDVRRSA